MIMPPRAQNQNPNQNKGGLNENYAREIMELHTLGVNGGYTQKDVTELARVFTGWSIAAPRQGGELISAPQLHDVAPKTVLGVHFPAGGGIEEGEKMIHVLAHEPANSSPHIAYELCQRTGGGRPAARTRRARGEEVSRHRRRPAGDRSGRNPEPRVLGSANLPRQGKLPFVYEISAVRAMGATIENPMAIARTLQQTRRAALRCAAAHRLLRCRRHMGEHRRPDEPAELRAGAGRQQSSRRQGRSHKPHSCGRGGRCGKLRRCAGGRSDRRQSHKPDPRHDQGPHRGEEGTGTGPVGQHPAPRPWPV